jgi:hypothetical protein
MVRHFLPAEGTQNGKSKFLLQLKKDLFCFDGTKTMFSYI